MEQGKLYDNLIPVQQIQLQYLLRLVSGIWRSHVSLVPALCKYEMAQNFLLYAQ